ncbi:glycosyltransferase family 4 protein [Seonamhaeicola sp.]|uniref:glycosyltransferase family 4 protein n=1 Tax=Seonamhaeicola sp. TaxID=1912245 RepID=UPI0026054045|nr:glycosyltransferase family 4 protein [Seonamhaeicola sp.]
MRVLQLVDSLELGGTERVAVNTANALSHKIDKSFLCATRKEGLLKESLNDKVEYLFLDKNKTLDFKAIKRLKGFIKVNEIGVVHAHSSSFFLAVLVKLFRPRLKIIWHDHYGNSEFLEQRRSMVLSIISVFFSHIISVNELLKNWAEDHLKCARVDYLPNFAIPDNNKPLTKLKGNEGKRIVHLANLRPQKNHKTLLKAFKAVIEVYPDWTLHCIGKDLEDKYSQSLKSMVDEFQLNNKVFFYGSRQDISHILKGCDIAVLSSKSEGLPIALLEYGFAKLPTVVTNVGDCSKVISSSNEGLIINKADISALTEALVKYISDERLRSKKGRNLFLKVNEFYSENAIINKLINIYKLHVV